MASTFFLNEGAAGSAKMKKFTKKQIDAVGDAYIKYLQQLTLPDETPQLPPTIKTIEPIEPIEPIDSILIDSDSYHYENEWPEENNGK